MPFSVYPWVVNPEVLAFEWEDLGTRVKQQCCWTVPAQDFGSAPTIFGKSLGKGLEGPLTEWYYDCQQSKGHLWPEYSSDWTFWLNQAIRYLRNRHTSPSLLLNTWVSNSHKDRETCPLTEGTRQPGLQFSLPGNSCTCSGNSWVLPPYTLDS